MAYLNLQPATSGMSGLGRRRPFVVRRRRGVGVTIDCVADPSACQNAVPWYVGQSQTQTFAATAQYAPPVYTSSFQSSNDPSVFTDPVYVAAMQVASAIQAANEQNANTFANYQNVYNNWLLGNQQGAPPSPPTYVTPQGSGIVTLPPGSPLPAGTRSPLAAGAIPSIFSGAGPFTAYNPPAAVVPNPVTNQGPLPPSSPAPAPSVAGSTQTTPPTQTTTNPLGFVTQPVDVFGSSFPIWELALAGILGFIVLRKAFSK